MDFDKFKILIPFYVAVSSDPLEMNSHSLWVPLKQMNTKGNYFAKF